MMPTFKPESLYVRTIGRTYYSNGVQWLAPSGAGVEFTFTGEKALITVRGDDAVFHGGDGARIGIYIDEERVVDSVVNEPAKTFTVAGGGTGGQSVTVRIVKLSEAAMSTVGIEEIRVDSPHPILPTVPKLRKIEFVGDSITAGYGVDDENPDHSFSIATEDVTKTYAYKTARALDAEYSIVAYSGYGIISGYTENGQKQTAQLVPTYYDKVGFSFGRFDSTLDVASLSWDFTKFVPDLIVVNLGTNDDSYTGDHGDRQTEFLSRYVDFLKQIRSRNGDAMILCTLGIMGDRLFPSVERAVDEYKGETGDEKIATMRFELQSPADGYSADWHPTEATQTKAADRLISTIKDLMKW